jgi:hypothetical protein
MTTVEIAGDWLTVRFTSAEQVLGRLVDLDNPLTAVTHAEHLGGWQDACRGSGLLIGVPDIWIIGTRTHGGTHRLISLRRRRGRALRITLTGQPFDELILSVTHSHRVLHALADGRWTDHATDPSWAISEIEALPTSPARCRGSQPAREQVHSEPRRKEA